jgi:hypothetical protein
VLGKDKGLDGWIRVGVSLPTSGDFVTPVGHCRGDGGDFVYICVVQLPNACDLYTSSCI